MVTIIALASPGTEQDIDLGSTHTAGGGRRRRLLLIDSLMRLRLLLDSLTRLKKYDRLRAVSQSEPAQGECTLGEHWVLGENGQRRH